VRGCKGHQHCAKVTALNQELQQEGVSYSHNSLSSAPPFPGDMTGNPVLLYRQRMGWWR